MLLTDAHTFFDDMREWRVDRLTERYSRTEFKVKHRKRVISVTLVFRW